VKRRGKLARASFDEVGRFEKKGFWSRPEGVAPPNGLSAPGDRMFGKRSSSMRPVKVLEKAMTGTAQTTRVSKASHTRQIQIPPPFLFFSSFLTTTRGGQIRGGRRLRLSMSAKSFDTDPGVAWQGDGEICA